MVSTKGRGEQVPHAAKAANAACIILHSQGQHKGIWKGKPKNKPKRRPAQKKRPVVQKGKRKDASALKAAHKARPTQTGMAGEKRSETTTRLRGD